MLGAPSASQQGFDVSAFRTGLTPDLSNFKTGLTPVPPGMSMPPTSPNTAAWFAMVSSNGAANVHSGSVNANTGMLSITANGSAGAPGGTLTPNTLNALTHTTESPDYFSGRASGAGLERPGSRLRNSVVANTEDGQQNSVSPDMMESRAVDPQSSPATARAGGPGSGTNTGGDHSAASGLYLLSQAHHELSKREGNMAAAQAAAQALQGVPRPTKAPAQTKAPAAASAARTGSKRKKPSPAAQEATDKKSRGAGKRARPAENKRRKGSPSPPEVEAEDEDSDGSSQLGSSKPGAGGGTEEEKRKNFLERNRQAALKCRQRKKAWLQSLQQTVEVLKRENEGLNSTVEMLQQEVVYLRAQIMQQNGATAPPQAPPGPVQGQGQGQAQGQGPWIGRAEFLQRINNYPYPMPPPPPPSFPPGLGVDGKKVDVQ